MSFPAERLHPQFIKDGEGKNSFVVLPTDEYEELLEDLQDLAAIAERRTECTITLEEIAAGLRREGVL